MNECKLKYPLMFYPVLKQTLWGGDRIIPFLSLEGEKDRCGVPYAELDHVGEYWAVSGIEGFESVVKGGELDGVTLSELVGKYGESLMGKKNYARFGKRFPLLVKFIDAALDLSVQVHPNDAVASLRHCCSGKDEMCYIVDSQNRAKLLSGFASAVTREEYDNMSTQQIMESLHEYETEQGDMFYLPAGTVHSIGAGAFIAEIQQSSDITYRIYDFDRKDKDGNFRELHTAMAAEAIDFSRYGSCKIDYSLPQNCSEDAWDHAFKAVECNHFITSLMSLENDSQKEKQFGFNYSHLDSFVILTCVKGSCTLIYNNCSESEKENLSQEQCRMEIRRGNAVLLPADLKNISFEIPSGVSCEILETHI